MYKLNGKILAGKILVKPHELSKKTEAGIIIPDTAKDKPMSGVVVVTGEPKKNEPMEVKEGDTVFYGKNSGITVRLQEEDYLLMNQSDIYFISI